MGTQQKKSQAAKVEALHQEIEKLLAERDQLRKVNDTQERAIRHMMPHMTYYSPSAQTLVCVGCHTPRGLPHDEWCSYTYLVELYGDPDLPGWDDGSHEREYLRMEPLNPLVGRSLDCAEDHHKHCNGFRDGRTRRCGCKCHTDVKEVADLPLETPQRLSPLVTYALLGAAHEAMQKE